MPVDAAAVHARVDFELALKQVQGNHSSFTTIAFSKVALGANPEWLEQLTAALVSNTTCTELDLSSTDIGDAALQRLVVALCRSDVAPQLRVLDLRQNPFSLAGETMLSGLRRLRPALECRLCDEPGERTDGFVHDKMLVEGLSAWPAESLSIPGSQDLRCPKEIVGSEELVVLKKGFQGSNGTKYTCDDAEFEMGHTTGNLVLKRLEPEAKMRLASVKGDISGARVSSGHVPSETQADAAGTLV